jgi:hypothetical protein
MAENIGSFELKTVNDYKYLAYVVGDKLRNTNFQPSKREVFLKALLEHLKPACSLKAYDRIEKSVGLCSFRSIRSRTRKTWTRRS